MHPDTEDNVPEDRQIQAILHYDEELAAGRIPPSIHESDSKLLAVHRCQDLLESLWPRTSPLSATLPCTFGRFQLERELGRGGFGVVYLATDTKLKRKVALKIPHSGLALSPDTYRRFLREGEAGSRLDHPHIVTIFEIGEQAGVGYIASAFCDGMTVAEWLSRRSNSVPPRIAADLLFKLASAVGHAHERGILHRDLKPKNVILQGTDPATVDRDDLELVPRICDFGLAKILDQQTEDTCTGVPIGSPTYMAPEQASGRHREVSPATDVYALGVILYEILGGRTPFRGETVVETLRNVSEGIPPSPRTLRPGLPRDLDTICMKCLEKQPGHRYANASELAADLSRFLEGRPVQARPVSRLVRLRKWARRHPAVVAIAGVISLAILGAIVGLAWAGARERILNNDLRAALGQTRVSERRARQLWASGQIRLAQLNYELGKIETTIDILESVYPKSDPSESKSFAWSYLDRLCRSQLPYAMRLPSESSLRTIATDARRLAIANEKGIISVCDITTGTTKLLNTSSDGPILHLEFSPVGNTLASSSSHALQLWDVDRLEPWPGGPLIHTFVNWHRFSRDGRAFTSLHVQSDQQSPFQQSWRLDLTERKATTLASPTNNPRPALFFPKILWIREPDVRIGAASPMLTIDGGLVAVDDVSDSFRLFDATTWQVIARAKRTGDDAVFLKLGSPIVALPDIDTGFIRQIVAQFTGSHRVRHLFPDQIIRDAEFSSNGLYMAIHTSKPDGHDELAIVDVASGRPLTRYELTEVAGEVSFRFASERRLLIVQRTSSKAVLWDWQGRLDPPPPAGHEKELWSLAYSPDSRTLASSSDDGLIKLWDAASGRHLRTLEGHDSLVSSIAFSPNGKLIASASFDKSVRLWNAATGQPIAILMGHTRPVRSLAFSHDGRHVASAGDDRDVRIWDVSTCSSKDVPLKSHTLAVYAVAFSPDGRFLCSAGDDRKICVWEASTGRLLREYISENRILSIAFSPDGKTLATSSVDGSIMLWDVDTGTPRSQMYGHSLEVLALTYSLDGSTLASAGHDMTVRLWDSATGQEQLTLKGHQHRIHAVAFSPDGSTLASGSFDGKIKLWRSRDPVSDRATPK